MNSPAPLRLRVLGLARDCEDSVPSFALALKGLRASNFDVEVVVGEDGSRDNTRLAFETLAAEHRVRVIDTSNDGDSRFARMAKAREALRLASANERIWPDAVLVVDLDEPFLETMDPVSLRAAVRWLSLEPVFGISATSSPYFYDLIAYEDENQSFNGLSQKLAQVAAIKYRPVKYWRYFNENVFSAQKRLTKAVSFECRSSFNGAVVYEPNAFHDHSYMPHKEGLCEHVPFHQRIADETHKHMVVTPLLAVRTPRDHGPVSAPVLWGRQISRFNQRLGRKIYRRKLK